MSCSRRWRRRRPGHGGQGCRDRREGRHDIGAVCLYQRIPHDGRIDHYAENGLPGAPERPDELGVAVGEDATITGHQPVALSVSGGRHADDGLVEVDGTRWSRRTRRHR